jgi:hypothetical protein
MALFSSEVYDAFREIGVSHEKALAAACAMYVAPPVDQRPFVSLRWLFGIIWIVLAAFLLLVGFLLCRYVHPCVP